MVRSSSLAPVTLRRKWVIIAGATTVSSAASQPAGDRAGQPDAPPDAGVAEVVGVPGPAPEAGVEHRRTLVAGPGAVRRQLPVADHLEEQPDRPDEQPEADRPRPGRARDGGRLERQRHQPHRRALHHEDPAYRGREAAVAEHRRVPGVLALAARADQDVPGEPQPPDGDHRDQQPGDPGRRDQRAGDGDGHQGETPGDVDDVDPADPPGDQRRDDHRCHGHCQRRAGDDQQVAHQVRTAGSECSAPGLTLSTWSTPMRPSRNDSMPPTR